MELRPLAFGEIFDRAVTLYIKNFVPFAAIVVVMIVPFAVLQYFIARGTQGEFDVLIQTITHPGQTPPPRVPMFWDSPSVLAAYVGLVLVAVVVSPFVLNAVAVGVARLYRNLSVDFRACYAAALRRWPQILGVMALEVLALVVWYVVVIVLAVAVVMLVAGIGAVAPALGVALGIVIGLGLGVSLFALLAAFVVALSFAMYAAVLEERGPVGAMQLGFQRVFNRAEFWRSMLFAVAYVAVLVGASMTLGALGLVATIFHQAALRAMIDAVSQAVISPFGTILMAVYYFDVRIRREGFDLEAGLDRLTGAALA